MRIDLIVPVHNEAASIAATVEEWFRSAEKEGVDLRIVVCEDGSTDGTADMLLQLAERLPLQLVNSPKRKGYSQAVVDGIRAADAPWVCCADGDGQCDPSDLGALLRHRADGLVVAGVRSPRRDPWSRRAMSSAMRAATFALHGLRQPDPSSPFCLMPLEVARRIAANDPLLPQGYWWEFHVRRERLGIDVVTVPVNHRVRHHGDTRVYTWHRIPTVARRNLAGLWRLRRS